MPISKAGLAITTLEEWEANAGPKSHSQWVDGRSAKEAALCWLEGGGQRLPPEIEKALANHAEFGPVESWTAEPECKLRFDNFGGEPRNSDLVVHAVDQHGPYLIAVEAKADESFGETVSAGMNSALNSFLENERSRALERVLQLVRSLFGNPGPDDPPVKDIRYQLMTACAGAICEAEHQGWSRTLLLVQEFVTEKTKDDRHAANARDLNVFAKRLSNGAITEIASGSIQGPFVVAGPPLFVRTTKLFIGKVGRNLRLGPTAST